MINFLGHHCQIRRTEEFGILWQRWNCSFISTLEKSKPRREHMTQHQGCWHQPEEETGPAREKETQRNSASVVFPTQPAGHQGNGPHFWPLSFSGGLPSGSRTTGTPFFSSKKKKTQHKPIRKKPLSLPSNTQFMKSDTRSERKHSAFPADEQNDHNSARLSECVVWGVTSDNWKKNKKKNIWKRFEKKGPWSHFVPTFCKLSHVFPTLRQNNTDLETDTWIHFNRLVCPPCSLMSGLAALDAKCSSRLGLITVSYYLWTTFVAVVVGIIMVSIIHPGGAAQKEDSEDSGKSITSSADALLDLIRWVGKNTFQLTSHPAHLPKRLIWGARWDEMNSMNTHSITPIGCRDISSHSYDE